MTSRSREGAAVGTPQEQILRFRVALHEAGHAVAAVVFRLGLQRVSIARVESDIGIELGACELRQSGDSGRDEPAPARVPDDPAAEAAYEAWVSRKMRQMRDLEAVGPAHVVMTLAGPIAERRFATDLPWSDVSCAADVMQAHELVSWLRDHWQREWRVLQSAAPDRSPGPAISADVDRRMLTAAMAEGQRVVDAMWPAAMAIARTLRQRPRISGAYVRQLVREHGGIPAEITRASVWTALRAAARGAPTAVNRPAA